MRQNRENPIGVFDSGLGGLTVMKQLMKLLPHEDILYFADTAHLPYGEKSRQYLIERSSAILSFFEEKKTKLIVIACHTASANALPYIASSIPLLGIVEPALDAIVWHAKKRIAVLATKATLDSGVYQIEIKKRIPEAAVFPCACPKFVPLIEEGKLDHPLMKLIVHETVKELQQCQIDAALLGSTHYPLIRPLIKNALGPSVALIDPAAAFANTIGQYLAQHQLLNEQSAAGSYHFFSSKNDPQFPSQASCFLEMAATA